MTFRWMWYAQRSCCSNIIFNVSGSGTAVFNVDFDCGIMNYSGIICSRDVSTCLGVVSPLSLCFDLIHPLLLTFQAVLSKPKKPHEDSSEALVPALVIERKARIRLPYRGL